MVKSSEKPQDFATEKRANVALRYLFSLLGKRDHSSLLCAMARVSARVTDSRNTTGKTSSATSTKRVTSHYYLGGEIETIEEEGEAGRGGAEGGKPIQRLSTCTNVTSFDDSLL